MWSPTPNSIVLLMLGTICTQASPHTWVKQNKEEDPGGGGLGKLNSRKGLSTAGEISPAFVVLRPGIECAHTQACFVLSLPSPSLAHVGRALPALPPPACEPCGGRAMCFVKGKPPCIADSTQVGSRSWLRSPLPVLSKHFHVGQSHTATAGHQLSSINTSLKSLNSQT